AKARARATRTPVRRRPNPSRCARARSGRAAVAAGAAGAGAGARAPPRRAPSRPTTRTPSTRRRRWSRSPTCRKPRRPRSCSRPGRAARRRARIAKAGPEVAAAPPRPPRRRAAFLAHADRESIAAAVLLARETRLVEGIWIYPQQDLMTFFRGVATDLRDDTPIYVIGFVASPARDAIRAASLYRDRLTWFDHHEWPSEDLEGLRAA